MDAKRHDVWRVALVLVAVLLAVVLVCGLVACGDKKTDDPVTPSENTLTPTDTDPEELVPEGYTLMQVEGFDYSVQVAKDFVLKVEPVSKVHYDFVRYKLTAPDGTVYYSSMDGQQWQKGEEGIALPWKWPYDLKACTLVPEFAPKDYKVYFAANKEAVVAHDAALMSFIREITFGEDLGPYRNMMMDKHHELAEAVYGVHRSNNDVFDMEPVAWVCFDSRQHGADVELTDSASKNYQFMLEYSTLNEKYYFDEEAGCCYLGIEWAPVQHSISYNVRNADGQWQWATKTDGFILGGSLQLATDATFAGTQLGPHATAVIGWSTTKYFVGDGAHYDNTVQYVDYELGGWYELKEPIDPKLYAVYVDLPTTPALCGEGLRLRATTADTDVQIEYAYATNEDLTRYTVFDGDLTKLPASEDPYHCRAVTYRTYNEGRTRVDSEAALLSVRINVADPTVSVANNTLAVSMNGSAVNAKNKVYLKVDDGAIRCWADLPDDFLTWLDSGDHTIRVFIEETASGVVRQTAWSEPTSFTVRSDAHEWSKKSNNVFIGNIEITDCSATVKYYNGNLSDYTNSATAVNTISVKNPDINTYSAIRVDAMLSYYYGTRNAKYAMITVIWEAKGHGITKKAMFYYDKDSDTVGRYDPATGVLTPENM